MERIEGVDGRRRPYRLTVTLGVRENQEIEISPEESDEEHDLAGDEQRHAIAQPQSGDGRMQARCSRLVDDIAPPEKHGDQYDDHTGCQDQVVAKMRGDDDAEDDEETAQ